MRNVVSNIQKERSGHTSSNLILCVCVCVQVFVTFSAVFGVVIYRICMLSVWSMNPDPEAKASVRMTVTTTGIILNMLVVLVLEEVYGAIAVWLTELGTVLLYLADHTSDQLNGPQFSH